MRLRIWAAIGLTMLAVILTGCSADRAARSLAATPVPTKTLRPTFTSTPAKPTNTPTAAPAAPTAAPAEITAEAPTATPEPPTPTATPEPQVARFTTGAAVNVRSGPGTAYGQIGQLQPGQAFAITGKSPAGDWLQFDFNGRVGWVLGQLVRVSGAELVQVAQNIPPAPTARPRPTAAPRPVAPAPPAAPAAPAATNLFQQISSEPRLAPDANFQWVTFWGRLGKTGDAAPISGYKLRVSAPSGTQEADFGSVWQDAYGGISGSQFRYNAKIELPRTAGGYRAVVVDAGGNEVSDAISGTLSDTTHDVILTWWKR